ncbi:MULTISPECIES: AmiS/UreI family transporter [Pseudonocardia]|uniref:Acid-activated urea channel n=2 Tax=Pseudonocardia TaxID=1847 RepID=A0A1Y2MV69_PSEAH|nr:MULTISPECIES: AmiS/UreI family transporter [Pseudonocardia]OSY38687.1 Acid-activated urea channel [Pseudonocardia autotrophica]TDN74889.1 AmiS/UreI family transporter [Pseudonocardia autotrophica]BBF98828.1 transporter [Pseudonocardia autotrophica]GEC26546.1 transporter [Pseudonocardia saturnea]
MGSVGLLFVGAVLFINGAMLLGWVDAKSAAPMNFFVGGLQIVTPTYLIFTAGGDADVILFASGLYLFSFTYLYVALNITLGLDSSGLGYFCLFVFLSALVFSWLNFTRFADPGFGVIWLHWAFLWLLFFLLLGLKQERLGRYTGAVCAIQGWVTAWFPALLLLTGAYAQFAGTLAVALAVFGVVVYGGLLVVLGRRSDGAPVAPAEDRNVPA